MLKKLFLALTCFVAISFADSIGNVSLTNNLKINKELTPLAKDCIECHAKESPGIVNDWRNSRHAHVGVSCVDCHNVKADSPMAQKAPHPKNSKNYISGMVSSKTCAKCHEKEVAQFNESGHARGGVQMFAKKPMLELMYHYEGADHPDLKFAPSITGCIQCHGSVIELDQAGKPKKETWPNFGIGTAYPDGAIGSCVACHSRHKFDMAEARKPAACASCHLGPDHPNIEIYNNSMHGHIFNTEGSTYKFDAATGVWDVPDFRTPTCAVCHMAGVGELKSTHNVSERLKWNLWAPHSNLRTKGVDTAAAEWAKNKKVSVGNALAGHKDGVEAARKEMKMVCKQCHGSTFTDNFFVMGDQMVELYNYYNDEAMKMLNDLKEKKLLKADEWSDPFQVAYYYSWHHEGRRMRMGAMMGAPDYAHWHGVFDVQQQVRKMRVIYEQRIKSGKIE